MQPGPSDATSSPTGGGAAGLTIDVHAHVSLGEIEAQVAGRPGLAVQQALDARRTGARSIATNGKMIGSRIAQLTDVTRRLSDMDTAGVDIQLVSPAPQHTHYWADRDLAAEICRHAAAGVAAHIANAPDRLVGLGLVPLQHTDLAVTALEQAMLSYGLRGVEISTHAGGAGPDGRARDLSDPALEPFWAKAAELGAIVFLHPYGCTLDERLDQWYLSNIVGNPVETAVALSHVIFSGVLDRHPDLRLLVAHGGGYLPTYIGRSDHGWRVRPESDGCVDPPSTYLRRMWFDSLVFAPPVLRLLVDTVGADRVLLGTDYPFDMGMDDPVGLLTATGLEPGQIAAIRGGNAATLLNLV